MSEYPITPEYLEAVSETIAAAYRRLEVFVLDDICSRFRVSGEATQTALELIRQLQRRGYSLEQIEAYIKQTLNLTDSQYDEIFNSAIERNQVYYDDVLTKNGLIATPFDEASMIEELMAIRRQTKNELVNITQSMGFAMRGPDGKVTVTPIGEVYQRVLDDAAMKVWSGAEDYQSAIYEATDQLTASGLQWVDYESGHHNRVDVAARRAVMTGIVQLSGQYANFCAETVPTPYWEITAHIGARDIDYPNPWSNHKRWQGKVYSERAGDIYPNLYAVTGYGEVDGLMGANCRHIRHPFWEEISERTYTDEELENIDPPPFEFEGKTYTAYEATQKQRQIEAAMRKTRRDLIRDKALGRDDKFVLHSARYNRLNEEYDRFSKAAGLPTQRERMRVAGFDSKLAREAMRRSK